MGKKKQNNTRAKIGGKKFSNFLGNGSVGNHSGADSHYDEDDEDWGTYS
jgi:hypothetical protein